MPGKIYTNEKKITLKVMQSYLFKSQRRQRELIENSVLNIHYEN